MCDWVYMWHWDADKVGCLEGMSYLDVRLGEYGALEYGEGDMSACGL